MDKDLVVPSFNVIPQIYHSIRAQCFALEYFISILHCQGLLLSYHSEIRESESHDRELPMYIGIMTLYKL